MLKGQEIVPQLGCSGGFKGYSKKSMVRQKRTRPWPMEKPAVLDMQYPECPTLQIAAAPSLPGPGPHIGGAMPSSPQVLTAAFKKGEIGQRGQPPFQPSSAGQTFHVPGSRPHLQLSPMLPGGSATRETNVKENGLAKKYSPVPVVEGLVVYGPGLTNNVIWRSFRKKYWTRLCNKSSLLEGKQGIQQWLAARIHSLLPPPSALPGFGPFDDVLVVLFSDAESRRKAMQFFLNSGIELAPYTVSSRPDAFLDVRCVGRRPIPNPTRGMDISDNSSCSSSVPSIEGGEQGQLKHDLLPSWKRSGQQHNSLQQLPVETIPAKIAPATEGGGKPKCEIQRSAAFSSASRARVAIGSVKKLPSAPMAADSPVPLQAINRAGSASPRPMIDVQSEMELHRSRVVAALGSQMNKSKKKKRNGRKTTTTKQSSLPATSFKVENRPTSVIKATTPPAEVQQLQNPVLNEQLISSLVTCRMTKALMAGDSSSLIRTDYEKEAQTMLLKMSKGIADDGSGGAHLPSSASDDLEEGELSPGQPNPPTAEADSSSTMGSETADEIAKQRELVLIALKLSRSKSKLNNKESDFSSVSRGSTEEAATITTKKNESVTSSFVSFVKNNSTLPNEEGAVSNAGGGGSSSMSTDNNITKQLKESKPKRPLQEKPKPSPHVVSLRHRVPTPAASDALINLRANNRIQKLVIFRSTPAAGGGNDAENYPYSIKGPFFGPDGMGVFPSGWANGHAASSVPAAVKQQKREMELRELQCKERALRLTNIQGRIKRKEQELKDLQENIIRYDGCVFTAQLSSARLGCCGCS